MYFSNEINNHLENKKPHDTKANTCHNWSWYGNPIRYRSSYRDIGFTKIVAHPKVFALTIAMVITMAVAIVIGTLDIPSVAALAMKDITGQMTNTNAFQLGFYPQNSQSRSLLLRTDYLPLIIPPI
jgi:hypothetical protein